MAAEKHDTTEPKVPSQIPPVYGKIVLSLDNCLLSQDRLERSPSVVDGLDPETEYDLRMIGCEHIQTAGILLKLPQVAMATGQVLLQRFYFSKSFVRHPMDITAMGCIYLASKIEEAPRRIRDVINVFHHMKQVRCQKPITPLILDQQYINLKSQVIKAERRILKELGFCVHVKHPHKLVVLYLQVLMLEKNRAALQMAWNYINDSLRTNVFLQYSPETVACAGIYLTARKLKIVLPKNPQWFSLFNVEEKDILEVCRKNIEIYQRPKVDPEVLESRVEMLKKSYEEERGKLRNNVVVISGNSTPNSNASQPKTPTPPPKLRKVIVDLSPKRSERDKDRDSSPKRNERERDRNRDSSPKRNERERDRDRDFSPKRNERDRDRDFSPKRNERDRDRDFSPKRNERERDRDRDFSPKRNERERDRDRDSSPKRNERERDRDRDSSPKRNERERDRDRDYRSKKDRDYRSSRRDRDYRSSKKDRRREIRRSPFYSKIRI